MSDLVEYPEDRFSHNEAQMMKMGKSTRVIWFKFDNSIFSIFVVEKTCVDICFANFGVGMIE